MDFQAYNKILICDDEVVNVQVDSVTIGYEFKIKYPLLPWCFSQLHRGP